MLPENIRSVQPEDETSEISPEQPENIRSGLIHIPKKMATGAKAVSSVSTGC